MFKLSLNLKNKAYVFNALQSNYYKVLHFTHLFKERSCKAATFYGHLAKQSLLVRLLQNVFFYSSLGN